jgi:hypothetical protein
VHDPWVVRELLHRDAGFGIDVEAAIKDIETAFAQRFFNFRLYFEFSLFYELNGLIAVVALERKVAMKHAVENDATGPDVDSSVYFIVFSINKTFWGHVS